MSLPEIQLRFHPDETQFPTWFEGSAGGPQQPPCFIARGKYRLNDIVYWCEGYQFYYRHNLAIGLGGIFPTNEDLGYHEHDVDGIYVLFDMETREPRAVYFEAHGTGQGSWRTWEECEKTATGGLVVYVALHSHASYPTSRTVVRIFGLGNDRLSSRGRHVTFTPENHVGPIYHDFGHGIVIYRRPQALLNRSVTQLEQIVLPFVARDLREEALLQ